MNQPEQSPQSRLQLPEFEYDDALAELDRSDVLAQIAAIEDKVNRPGAKRPSGKALNILDELLLLRDTERALFSGLVHEQHSDGSFTTKGSRVFIDADVTFEGADYATIGEELRVVFAMKRAYLDHKTKKATFVRYAAPFGDILRLEYMQQPLLRVLERYGRNSRGLVLNEDFLQASMRDQTDLLATVTTPCYDELESRLDRHDVEVTCERYFVCEDVTSVDQVPEFVPHDGSRKVLIGSFEDCLYPDVLGRQKQKRAFRMPKDFTFGPVPYVVLRDDIARATAFVAIDQITSIR
jgi:hypothetical protein